MSWSSYLAAQGCSVAWVVYEEWPTRFSPWTFRQFQEIVHLLPAYPSNSSQLEVIEQRAGCMFRECDKYFYYLFSLGVALKISLV